MKRVVCVSLVLLATMACGLQTQSLRGAGNHSAHLQMQGNQPEDGDLLSRIYKTSKKEASKVRNIGELEEDLLTDGDNNTLYNDPDSIQDYTESISPNPSWEGKETLTRDKIKKLVKEAKEDVAKDKDYVNEEDSDLFITWARDQDLDINESQLVNQKFKITRKKGTYRILDTTYRNWAGSDLPGIEEAERLAEYRAIAEKIKAERWKKSKKNLRAKQAEDRKIRDELKKMTFDELKLEAVKIGALKEELDDAEQAKKPEIEMIHLILRYRWMQEERKMMNKPPLKSNTTMDTKDIK